MRPSGLLHAFRRNPAPPTLSAVDVGDPTDTVNLPEAELLRRAQAGEQDAFGVLMRAHYETTFRLVQSIIRDEHAARDVCQEVWLSAWRNLRRFRGDAKFTTWIHPIAVRRSIDHLRSRKRWYSRLVPIVPRDEQLDSDGPRIFSAPEPVAEGNPREEAEREERKRRFEQAIESLPPKHRAVLALREIKGLSYEEIADTLSIRRGTVMSRLFNARRMLVQKLGDLPCD